MPHRVATLIYLSQNYLYHIRGDMSPLIQSLPCMGMGPAAVVKDACLKIGDREFVPECFFSAYS